MRFSEDDLLFLESILEYLSNDTSVSDKTYNRFASMLRDIKKEMPDNKRRIR